MDKKRINASEMEGLKHLVAIETMAEHIGAIEGRIKQIPRGALRLGQLKSIVKSLKKDIYDTLPDNQRQNVMINFSGLGYSFGVRRPGGIGVKKNDYGLWVSSDFLNACEAAVKEHCAVCSLDTQQQRSFPYAKIRDEMPGNKDENARGCGYFGL